MSDELSARRKIKQYGTEDPRIRVNAFGDDGYVLIDCSIEHARELRDELNAELGA